MDKIRIVGGNPLNGKIYISGAKNAALPLMAACLLSDQPLTLQNVPHLADVTTMVSLLMQLGVDAQLIEANAITGRTMTLHAKNIQSTVASYDLVRTMRASILVLGPLLARYGKAKVSLPGGCAIGTRPVDLHIEALRALGAEITLEEGYINAVAPKGLKGCKYTFPVVSVTATENAMMAAALADGETEI